MGLFGRGGKKRDEGRAPAPTPNREAPRQGGDFFSPFWSNWPPPPAPSPVAEPPVAPIEPAPSVEVAAPIEPAAQKSSNPPPVTGGPAVVVRRVHTISDAPPQTVRGVASVPQQAIAEPRTEEPVPALPAHDSVPSLPLPVARPSRMRLALQRAEWREARALAEEILAADPSDEGARACVVVCATRIREDLDWRLGARDRIVRQSLPDEWLADLDLDPQVVFLLSRIDGQSSIDEILDVCGMPREQAAQLIVDLLEDGILEAFAPRPRPTSRPPRS